MESRIAGTVVHSFDFDGMLASDKYTNKLKELIIRAATEDRALDMNDYYQLASYILAEYKEFFDQHFMQNREAEHFVYVGSDRQDHKTDVDNGFKVSKGLHITLSCFPFFTALTQVLKQQYNLDIKMADLLLEDIYRQLPKGTSFKNISDAWLSLDKSFYKKIAKQFEHYDPDESHKLFMELRKYIDDPNSKQSSAATVRGDSSERLEFVDGLQDLLDSAKTTADQAAANSPQNPRLPKYTDSGKLLLIITQILDAYDRQSKGRLDLDYHLSDDRRDILNNAYNILCPTKNMAEPNIERKPFFMKARVASQPNEAPTTILSLLPDTTHIFLEQFLPPEDKVKRQEIDPHRFGDFVQPEAIIGTGRGGRHIKDIFFDIQRTHRLLNRRSIENPVSGALIQTVEMNAQNNALSLITKCVNDLIAGQPPTKLVSDAAFKAIKKIKKFLDNNAHGNNPTSPEELLIDIQKICRSILPSNQIRFVNFNKAYPEHAVFFKELANINTKNPRTDSLTAISHMIALQTNKYLEEDSRKPQSNN